MKTREFVYRHRRAAAVTTAVLALLELKGASQDFNTLSSTAAGYCATPFATTHQAGDSVSNALEVGVGIGVTGMRISGNVPGAYAVRFMWANEQGGNQRVTHNVTVDYNGRYAAKMAIGHGPGMLGVEAILPAGSPECVGGLAPAAPDARFEHLGYLAFAKSTDSLPWSSPLNWPASALAHLVEG